MGLGVNTNSQGWHTVNDHLFRLAELVSQALIGENRGERLSYRKSAVSVIGRSR